MSLLNPLVESVVKFMHTKHYWNWIASIGHVFHSLFTKGKQFYPIDLSRITFSLFALLVQCHILPVKLPDHFYVMLWDSCNTVVMLFLCSKGVAGCCAKSTIAPLDRIKILLQAQNPHYKHLGKSVLYLRKYPLIRQSINIHLNMCLFFFIICRSVCHTYGCAKKGGLSWAVQGKWRYDDQDFPIWSHSVYGFRQLQKGFLF